MTRKLEVVLEDWPKICLGGCGKLLRPAHQKADPERWPGTTASVLTSDPWCASCRYTEEGRAPQKHREGPGALTQEQKDARFARMREELEALWRDRRARGIDPQGTLMEGEMPEFPERQHRYPGVGDLV